MVFGAAALFHPGSSVSWVCRLVDFLLMLAVVMLLTSCEDNTDGPPSGTPTSQEPVHAPTSLLQPTVVSSPDKSGGETSSESSELPAEVIGLSFPRHHEVLPANRGDHYVYGELSRSGDCLRVSYVDQVDPVATRDGLLVVWPSGFEAREHGQLVRVFDSGGDLVASEEQTLRISGKKVAVEGGWDWVGSPDRCPGPFWLVGDEVSPVEGNSLSVASYGGILFATLGEQRGPIVTALEGVEGPLRLRGACLVVGDLDFMDEYLVVWPPGFRVEGSGEGLAVLNGGGRVIAELGDDVLLGGRSHEAGNAYSGECDGVYFNAYTVRRSQGKGNIGDGRDGQSLPQ